LDDVGRTIGEVQNQQLRPLRKRGTSRSKPARNHRGRGEGGRKQVDLWVGGGGGGGFGVGGWCGACGEGRKEEEAAWVCRRLCTYMVPV